MTVDQLRVLMDYHYWARDRLLDAAGALTSEQFTKDMGSSFTSIRDTLVHIYSAECIWYKRWLGETPGAHVDPASIPSVSALEMAWRDHERRMLAYLGGLSDTDLAKVVEYRMMDGKPASSVLWQMMQHLVNHASYHRGQVTTMMRQMGVAPAKSMDLIAFYRQGGAQRSGH